MGNKLIIGLILVLFLSACMSLKKANSIGLGLNPTANARKAMEKTLEYSKMQTIIANEQATMTPTPISSSKILVSSTETVPTTNLTPTLASAIATSLNPNTPVYTGPGFNYRMLCYLDKGSQISITGHNFDSSWFSVKFDQGQTCYRLYRFTVRDYFYPDPATTFWISSSSYTISGNPKDDAIKSPTPVK